MLAQAVLEASAIEVMIHIAGSPIGGENPPDEQRWRAAIANAATGANPAGAVRLLFRLEPHRTVDLDNLVRPALCRTARRRRVLTGYRHLDAIVATKISADDAGVEIDLTTAEHVTTAHLPTQAQIVAAHGKLPRDGDRQSKRHWRKAIRRQDVAIDRGAVWIDIAVNTTMSLEGLLKPIIDGLDPLLGADPAASLEFAPNDERIEWLRIHRQLNLRCAIVVAAGSMGA